MADKSLKEALSLGTHTLNPEEGIDVELGRLVDDGEERDVRERGATDGDGVRGAPYGEYVVIVDDRINADASREVEGRGLPPTLERRALRRVKLVGLRAVRAIGTWRSTSAKFRAAAVRKTHKINILANSSV